MELHLFLRREECDPNAAAAMSWKISPIASVRLWVALPFHWRRRNINTDPFERVVFFLFNVSLEAEADEHPFKNGAATFCRMIIGTNAAAALNY